jgi:hypothetical protein
MSTDTYVPMLRIDNDVSLPDNDQWQFRFEIRSESSNRIYTVAQHKIKKYWGCSCPGWKIHRNCKHLSSLNIPGKEKPYEPRIIKS